MRFFLIMILILATGAFAIQLYRLVWQYSDLQKEASIVSKELQNIEEENKKLTADLEYFKDNKHLEGEARKAGYALPDEKVLIIVPEKR